MRYKIIVYFSIFITCHLAKGQAVIVQDSNFRKCLATRYNNVLNENGELILKQAAGLAGSLLCINMGIQQVEELTYFTNVSEINLAKNQLSLLPDISALTNLSYLEVSENELTALPELRSLKNLKELYAQRNQLKTLPDLSDNTALNVLYVHTNLFDTLPDLSNLTKLTMLNVAINQLRYIPGINKLTLLRSLICWQNKLVALPPLTNLTELRLLNASVNQFTRFPVLPPGNKIATLLLEKNNIASIPAVILDSLTYGKLNNNNFTFSDLANLSSTQDLKVTTTVAPQAVLKVASEKKVNQYEALQLSTGIDTDLQTVSYHWYKNGIALDTFLVDSLIISSTQLLDSGRYMCQITHLSFPALVLHTDTFHVVVAPCIHQDQVNTEVTGIDCKNTGMLQVAVEHSGDIRYVLRAAASGKQLTSETGTFTGLHETRYILSLEKSDGCKVDYYKEIQIPVSECKEFLITPDNDGNMDTFYFTASGTVRIFDKNGYPVKDMKIPGEWDCTSAAGKVPVGHYTAYINSGEIQIGLSVVY